MGFPGNECSLRDRRQLLSSPIGTCSEEEEKESKQLVRKIIKSAAGNAQWMTMQTSSVKSNESETLVGFTEAEEMERISFLIIPTGKSNQLLDKNVTARRISK